MTFWLSEKRISLNLFIYLVRMNDEVDKKPMVKELKDGKDEKNKSSFPCKTYREDCPPCILNFSKT